MHRLLKHRPSPALAVSIVALVVALGGVAYATIPGPGGVIKGCYANTNGIILGIPHSKGDVRIVDSAEACRSYETTLPWNQQGPRGTNGATNVVVRAGTGQEVGASTTLQANCQPGERATGGGGTVIGGGGQGRVVDSAPVPHTPGVTPTGWATTANSNSTTSTVTLTPYVVCASP